MPQPTRKPARRFPEGIERRILQRTVPIPVLPVLCGLDELGRARGVASILDAGRCEPG